MKKQLCGLRRLGYLTLAALLALVVAPAAALADGDTTDDETTEETTDETTEDTTTEDTDGTTDDSTDDATDDEDEADATEDEADYVVMYRLYNQWTGEHLYTSDTNEYEVLQGLGWTDEDIAWYAVAYDEETDGTAEEAGVVAIYRLYNPYCEGGEHHYTADENEYTTLQELGWVGEGVAFYAVAYDEETDGTTEEAGVLAVYREYNPNAYSCNHNFTTGLNEHETLVGLGWTDEGIAWYVLDVEDEDDDATAEDDATTEDESTDDATDETDDDIDDSEMVDDDDMAVDSDDDDMAVDSDDDDATEGDATTEGGESTDSEEGSAE